MTSLMSASASKAPSSSLLLTHAIHLNNYYNNHNFQRFLNQDHYKHHHRHISSSPLTSLLHQKLTTTSINDSNSDTKTSSSSSSIMTQSNANQKKVSQRHCIGSGKCRSCCRLECCIICTSSIKQSTRISQNKQTLISIIITTTILIINNNNTIFTTKAAARNKRANSFNKIVRFQRIIMSSNSKINRLVEMLILRKRLSNINIEAALLLQ
ncbi:hypothetical protein PVAND_000745 [Polypedilum vanderplanki]|uniref:Uncharacterized protein n=1 Tax=Polypedilum vanderplanki TaxID=319348 RepID=A0A9J6BLZ2_POLVA|nr:hypothetical protein PVAND_000745 [Polypedilum vanderplanki]